MMFKRPRLRPVRPLVNVGLAASFIFICACSGDKPPAEEESTPNDAPAVAIETPERAKLQAVWATNALEAEIVDVAVAGGPNPLMAATLEDGQMQMFDLDGERLTEPASVGVTSLADGAPARLNDTQVTLFPGIGTRGDVNIYLYSAELGQPVAVDLLGEIGALGICAGAAGSQDALLQIGYWREKAPDTLIVGELSETDGEFLWEETSAEAQDGALGGCHLGSASGTVLAGERALAVIGQGDAEKVLRLGASGVLEEAMADGASEALPIRAGISIKVPEPIVAFTALPDARFGGYPNGVIIVAGDVGGAQKLVFVEPIGLFDE